MSVNNDNIEELDNLENQELNSQDSIDNSVENTEDNQQESKEEELSKKYDKLSDDYLRLMAEYDNYRKRTLKEKSELIRNGGEKVLLDLLPVVDDIEIALKNMPKDDSNKVILEGIELIYTKFIEFLSKQGVKPIETKDQAFDEEKHEAIAVIPAPSEDIKGKIVDTLKTGYTLNDKVIRHSSVVVAQ